MGTPYDFRGDFADAVILPASAERSMVKYEYTLDLATLAAEKDITGFGSGDTIKVCDIPAGVFIPALYLGVITKVAGAAVTEEVLDICEIGLGLIGANTTIAYATGLDAYTDTTDSATYGGKYTANEQRTLTLTIEKAAHNDVADVECLAKTGTFKIVFCAVPA